MSEETTKEQAEKKDAEVKAEQKAPEAPRPEEAKPAAAAAPADAKPADAKPAEAKPADAKPAEPKPEEKKEADGATYFYPNKWARIVFTSAEEVMGDRGVTALLNMANMKEYIDNYPPDNMKKEFPFERVGQLQQAIWDMYGNRGARVFATRAGEQSFKDGLSQFKSVAAAAQIAMKVGTLEAKAKIGLEFFSKFFNAVSDQVVEISEDDKHWIWTITRCPVCWNRKSDEPVCHLAVGVLQAAFAWISDNKKFRILETDCKAKGDKNCVFKIEKVPVE
jgi:predicted hydrocarbon binding protein